MTDKEKFMDYINEAFNNNKFTSNNILMYWDKLIANLESEELISENYTKLLRNDFDFQVGNKSSSSMNKWNYHISSIEDNFIGELTLPHLDNPSDQTFPHIDVTENEEETKENTNTINNTESEFDYDLFEELYRALIKVDKKEIVEELSQFQNFIKTNFNFNLSQNYYRFWY